ncbi:MAG: DinB family protein [Pseudomonadota bacterium]
MIDPAYCQTMVRYNAWENTQLETCLADLPPDELTRDRSAFFGSILATLNHIHWGDQMWMSRLAGWAKPDIGPYDALTEHTDLSAWVAVRRAMDHRLTGWADRLSASDLAGDLTWYSALAQTDQTQPKALCVAHMFNHQTHHRGQVHAMITQAGAKAPVSDLVFMPQGG